MFLDFYGQRSGEGLAAGKKDYVKVRIPADNYGNGGVASAHLMVDFLESSKGCKIRAYPPTSPNLFFCDTP